MSLRHLMQQVPVGHSKCVKKVNVPTIKLWAHDLVSVEVAGFEPASISVVLGLLRAHPQLRVLDLLVTRGLASNTVKVTV